MRHHLDVLAISLSISVILVGCGEKTPVESSAPAVAEPDATPPIGDLPEISVGEAVVKVNLNTATEEQFLALPEVTARMAHEFDEYRPYASIRQFRREIGKYVDEAQVARYEQFLFVPIAMNEADAETLQQIPGLDGAKAQTLIAGRPYAAAADFLEALASHVDAAGLEVARTYVVE